MDDAPRYALYFVPQADSALYRFGSNVLGYDCYTGNDLDGVVDLPDDRAELTSDPRRYGFHATLKAPFYLTPDYDEAMLLQTFRAFAAEPRAIASFAPVVRSLSGFLAIVPRETSAALTQFADDCVTAFDQFRAPMSDDDRARRNPARLSERQREQLDRWGYPYVFEDFRFHMTLTGSIPETRRPIIEKVLGSMFMRFGIPDTIAIDTLTLVCQRDPQSRFRVLAQRDLVAADAPEAPRAATNS